MAQWLSTQYKKVQGSRVRVRVIEMKKFLGLTLELADFLLQIFYNFFMVAPRHDLGPEPVYITSTLSYCLPVYKRL